MWKKKMSYLRYMYSKWLLSLKLKWNEGASSLYNQMKKCHWRFPVLLSVRSRGSSGFERRKGWVYTVKSRLLLLSFLLCYISPNVTISMVHLTFKKFCSGSFYQRPLLAHVNAFCSPKGKADIWDTGCYPKPGWKVTFHPAPFNSYYESPSPRF